MGTSSVNMDFSSTLDDTGGQTFSFHILSNLDLSNLSMGQLVTFHHLLHLIFLAPMAAFSYQAKQRWMSRHNPEKYPVVIQLKWGPQTTKISVQLARL